MADLAAFSSPPPSDDSPNQGPWYREMKGYHWFVLGVAALGWLFDCLDQQLFILARQPAMAELLTTADGSPVAKATIDAYAGYATSIFLIGWATGGLFFGVLGDRIGRAKTMMITILMYSFCTGLSALSTCFLDFAFYRFLTGLGVGGEFAVGVALVAEVMPGRARPYTLSLLQALSAVGNISAAFIAMYMGSLVQQGVITSTWRPMFVVGALPALLALVIRYRLKEPEQWEQAQHDETVTKELGSYRALFRDPKLRKNAFVGLALAFVGVVGLWAIVFFSMDLLGNIVERTMTEEGAASADIKGTVAQWKGVASLCLNLGAAAGMFGFGILAQYLGRRPAFAIGFIAAGFTTIGVFQNLQRPEQAYYMFPIMGFCMLSLFAGYAIYFPELFPTRLRSTGISFCYNVGRFVAAAGPALLGLLTEKVFAAHPEPLRMAGLSMCSIFLLGLLVLPFAPETKGQPLPD